MRGRGTKRAICTGIFMVLALAACSGGNSKNTGKDKTPTPIPSPTPVPTATQSPTPSPSPSPTPRPKGGHQQPPDEEDSGGGGPGGGGPGGGGPGGGGPGGGGPGGGGPGGGHPPLVPSGEAGAPKNLNETDLGKVGQELARVRAAAGGTYATAGADPNNEKMRRWATELLAKRGITGADAARQVEGVIKSSGVALARGDAGKSIAELSGMNAALADGEGTPGAHQVRDLLGALHGPGAAPPPGMLVDIRDLLAGDSVKDTDKLGVTASLLGSALAHGEQLAREAQLRPISPPAIDPLPGPPPCIQ